MDQYLSQPSSKKIPPAVPDTIYRDVQLDNVQRMKDLETVSLKRDGSIKFLYSGLG